MLKSICDSESGRGHSLQTLFPKLFCAHESPKLGAKYIARLAFLSASGVFRMSELEKSSISERRTPDQVSRWSPAYPRLTNFPSTFGNDSGHRFSQKRELTCCVMPRIVATQICARQSQLIFVILEGRAVIQTRL